MSMLSYLFKFWWNEFIALQHRRLDLLGNCFDDFGPSGNSSLTFPLYPCLRGINEKGFKIILDPSTRHCSLREICSEYECEKWWLMSELSRCQR